MTARHRGWIRAWATLVGWLAASATALACPICFQAERSGATDGARAAVIVLLAVTIAVLSGFAVFIVRFLGSGLEFEHRSAPETVRAPGDARIQDLTPRSNQ